MRAEVQRVGAGRLGELVELAAQVHDLLARGDQGVGEPLVLGRQRGRLPLGVALLGEVGLRCWACPGECSGCWAKPDGSVMTAPFRVGVAMTQPRHAPAGTATPRG